MIVCHPRTRHTSTHHLDVDHVPNPGGEATTVMQCFRRLQPHLPGCQTLIYDTALRGVHHQTILREFGWIPINRVQAKQPARPPHDEPVPNSVNPRACTSKTEPPPSPTADIPHCASTHSTERSESSHTTTAVNRPSSNSNGYAPTAGPAPTTGIGGTTPTASPTTRRRRDHRPAPRQHQRHR